MNISSCTELKNENISCELADLLQKELGLGTDSVKLLCVLDTRGQINIGFPENVQVVRAEEVLSKLTAQKVTSSTLITGTINPDAGVYSSGGWSIGFI